MPPPVADLMRPGASERAREGRPDLPALLILEIHRLAAQSEDRIVVPGRQTELAGIFRPSEASPGLRHEKPESVAGHHIRPGGGGRHAGPELDHVVTRLRVEPPERRRRRPFDALKPVGERARRLFRGNALLSAVRICAGRVAGWRR